MATFDSHHTTKASDLIGGKSEVTSSPGFSPDLSQLTQSENRSAFNNPAVNTGLHHMEIAAATVLPPVALGGALGAGYGLVAESAVQLYKYPLSVGLGAFGATGMASDLLKMESRYMATAGKFGAQGLALGAVFGAAIFAGYETKKYLEK